MHVRGICMSGALVLALAWPQVGHVSGTSTVTAASADFSLTMASVNLIATDPQSESDFHNSWKQTANHEINGLRARLGGLWPEVVAANPALQLLPFDPKVEACESQGPCKLSLSPALMLQVDLVVAEIPTDAQRTTLTASLADVLERKVPVEPAAIARDITGLGRTFPHLSGLGKVHFDGALLHYERGRTEEPNDEYDAQLAAYNAEVARRAAEDSDGNHRKRHFISPPTSTRTAWESNGVSLSVRFQYFDPAGPPEVRAAAGFVLPGYEGIILQRFPDHEEAEVGIWRVFVSIVGDDVEPLSTSIRDVLLFHGQR